MVLAVSAPDGDRPVRCGDGRISAEGAAVALVGEA